MGQPKPNAKLRNCGLQISASVRFCLTCGARTKRGNFLHAWPSSRLGSKLSNKPSYASFGGHLPCQPVQIPQVRNPGQNPVKGRKRVCLDELLNSIFYEILGHENTSKYLSNHGPKVGKRDQHNQALSSQRRREIPFTRVKTKTGCHLNSWPCNLRTCWMGV